MVVIILGFFLNSYCEYKKEVVAVTIDTSTDQEIAVSTPVKKDNLLADTGREKMYKGIKLQTGYNNYWNTIYGDLEYSPILIDGDHFIVGSNGYGPRAQVFAFNLKTGKELLLYNEYTDRLYINQIIKIGNTMFFSTGGYLALGGTYYVDLPLNDSSVVKKISDGRNGSIEEIEGRYWLVNGEGDACLSGSSYDLFNPNLKTSRFIASSGNDCGTGNNILISKDKVFETYFVGNESTSTYTHVIQLDIDSPSKKVEIITKEQMPVGVYKIKYDSNTNSLLLYGTEKYIFDLSSNALNKKDFVDPVEEKYLDEKTKTIQLLKSITLPQGYRIDFSEAN